MLLTYISRQSEGEALMGGGKHATDPGGAVGDACR